ncbi:MAG: Cytochrome b6-f complex iron-sulfur subunit [Anaerolineales bacterium]|nr:Cytochrome b6-f complex iron-sulfur subunit [Anaerolineales bacterium]
MSVEATAAEVEIEEGDGVTRREFLNYAWLASLGIFTAQLAGVSYLFAMPRFRAGEFGGVFPLGPAINLPEVGIAPEKNSKGRFWFVRSEEGVYALYIVCTHLGCLFQWQATENRFICPCHGSQFSRTGQYLTGPAPRNLDMFVVRVEDDQGNVLAETPAEEGPVPTPVPDPDAQVMVDTGARLQGKHK